MLLLIVFNNVSKSYGDLIVLENFNITIKTGEVVCLCGPSGIGKSTILKLIANIIDIDEGSLEVETKRLGYVFQEPRLLPWCNVIENVEMGLYEILPNKKESRRTLARDILNKVGLREFKDYFPSQLSGGMKQRVALARAFAIGPEILLLDEPFSALDCQIKDSLRYYLFELLDWKPCTTVLVTHDVEEAVRIGDRIIFLEERPCRIGYEQIIDSPRSERNISYWLDLISQNVN